MTQETMDFTTGSIFKKLLWFMLPILAALVLQTMYGAVDILIVGWFGSEISISAVSTGSSLIGMVVFVLNALAMGVTIIIGRLLGEKSKQRLNQIIGGGIALFLVISIFVTLLLLAFAPGLASLMRAPAAAYDRTITYIRICGGGIVFIIGYNFISSVFRGIGNSRLPLIFVLVACIFNVLLDILFVMVLHMDVAGAALATVLAQALSLALSILVCKKVELPFSINLSDIRLNREVRQILFLGFPIGVQEFLTQISFLLLLAFINGMGSTDAIRLASSSGYGVAGKVTAMIMLVPSALMQSMSSFIAQNVGAGQEKRAQKAMGFGMLIGGVIGMGMTMLAFFYGHELAAIFTPIVAYQDKAAEYLIGFSLEAIITSVLFSFIGYYNGHNQTIFVLLQGLAQSFLVRLPMAYAMVKLFPDNMMYVGAAMPVATMFGILLNTLYYSYYTKKIGADRVTLRA